MLEKSRNLRFALMSIAFFFRFRMHLWQADSRTRHDMVCGFGTALRNHVLHQVRVHTGMYYFICIYLRICDREISYNHVQVLIKIFRSVLLFFLF